MSTAVHIPRGLRDYCHCPETISVAAGTVVTVLIQLRQEYPSLYRSVCDETGRVRPHIHLFVNSDMVPVQDVGGLEMPLHPGDELKAPAVYFGTTTGQLWMGHDSGEEWRCLFDSLPPIVCVKTAVV